MTAVTAVTALTERVNVAAEVREATSLDVAVEQVWEMVLSGEAKDAGEAARALWYRLELSESDVAFLGIFGLGEYASREQSHSTRSARPGIGVGAPHGKQWDEYLTSLTWVYDDASGTPKPLLDFTLSDWASFAVRMDKQAQSYARRAELGRKAEALLIEHSKKCLADVPKVALREFAVEAKDVLGRQE